MIPLIFLYRTPLQRCTGCLRATLRWLADIHMFTGQLSPAFLETLRGCSPLKYNKLIKKLHFWIDRVHSLPPSFTTSNKLFTVKISSFQKDIGMCLKFTFYAICALYAFSFLLIYKKTATCMAVNEDKWCIYKLR